MLAQSRVYFPGFIFVTCDRYPDTFRHYAVAERRLDAPYIICDLKLHPRNSVTRYVYVCNGCPNDNSSSFRICGVSFGYLQRLRVIQTMGAERLTVKENGICKKIVIHDELPQYLRSCIVRNSGEFNRVVCMIITRE